MSKKINLHEGQFTEKEKGQSLVELAIGITILLLLLSGIVDIGRAIFTQFALQDAAEEGLIYGIANPDKCEEIIARVGDNFSNSILPASPTIAVTIGDSYAACGSLELEYGLRMDVSVSSPFVISMPFLAGNTLNLRGAANGTILRPPPETPEP